MTAEESEAQEVELKKKIYKWLTQSHMSSQHPGLMPEFEWSPNVVHPQIDNAMQY